MHGRVGLMVAGLLTIAAPALAQSPSVGDEAPELGAMTWVMNAPRESRLSALRGQVVFVEMWGVRCPPCLALIPHVQEMQEQLGPQGLHIFAIEAQGHSAAETTKTVTDRGGKTYPVATGGARAYDTGGPIPYGWLIGVDGKVVFAGNPRDAGFQPALTAELAKVRLPGVGRTDLDRALAKAVEKYGRQDLAGARKEAQKVLDNARSSDTAKADAQYLVERFTQQATRQLELATAYEGEQRYLEAQEVYTWLANGFKREPEGVQADERLDAMKSDPAIKKELDAAKRLQQMVAQLAGRPVAERRANLQRFAQDEKVQGTRAARDAQAMAQRLTG